MDFWYFCRFKEDYFIEDNAIDSIDVLKNLTDVLSHSNNFVKKNIEFLERLFY